MVRGKGVRGATNLPPAYQPVGLAGGIDTKTDYKLVTAPGTLQALNVRYGTAGSVRKRYGLAALGTLTGAITCFVTATELIACDSANMYAVTVGTGATTLRGSLGAATLSSNNILSVGTLATQLIRTVQTEYLQVGGVSYGLCVYEYGTNPATASGSVALGVDTGTTLYWVLFNAQNGSTIWTTTTSGLLASASLPFRFIGTAATPSVTTYPSLAAGAMYPVITAYNGRFLVSWIAALQTGTINDNGTSLSGCIYAVQTVAFVPTSTIPIAGTTVYTGTTVCGPFPAVIAGQPASGTAYSPVLPIPLRFDIRTSGVDVVLVANGQNYGAANGATAVLYRNAASIALFSNANLPSTFNVATLTAPSTALSAVTLGPGQNMYGLVYQTGPNAQLLFPTYPATPALLASPAVADSGTLGTPFSAGFTTNSAYPINLVATDGSSVASWNMVYSSPFVLSNTTLTFGSVANEGIDYSYTPIAALNGQLASRVFIYNNSAVAWYIPSSVSRSTITSLALVQVQPLITYNQPASKTLAQAAYLRACTAGVPVDYLFGYAPVNSFPQQACNVSTNTPSGNPATAYIGNSNSQERIISLRTLTVGPDTAGVARAVVRTPQGAIYLGAEPRYYDGSTCRKMGWLTIPEWNFQGNSGIIAASSLTNYVPSATNNNAGLCYNTAYTFFFVYVDYDAQGNTIYGSTSPPLSITTPNSATKTVLFVPQQMIPTRGYLQIYRNTGLNPLTYVKTRQFAQSDVKSYGGIYVGVVDDTGIGSAVNNNGVSTETLSGGLLYAPPSGGELPNDPAPASSMGVSTKQRIFLVSQEVLSWVFFSKPFFPGRAPEFNAGQIIDIDPTTGPITGIAALDSTIIVFKKGHIYSFGGDGPDATGSGSFTSTIAVATDLGCLDTASILTTEDGVWFRSGRGLQMLTRGGQVVYTATEVEPLLAGTTVVASALVADQNQIRFSLANGNVLVYDYLLKLWSVWVTFRPSAATVSAPTSFGKLSGAVYMTNQAGDLCVETPTVFTDGSNNIPMTVASAWIPTAGPQGWGRIRRVAALGDFRSAVSLTMSFSYDYQATPAYSIAYAATTTTQQSPYNWRVRAPRQVCQAVQITLSDNAPPGEGAILTGLVLELEPKSAALRVPDTQSV